jgi:hypothetical protein
LIKYREAIRPTGNNFFRRDAGLQLLHGIRVSDQLDHFRDVKLFRIEFLQNRRDFQPQAHGAHRSAIGDPGGHPAATLASVQPGNRDKRFCGKMHSRQLSRVQRGGDLVAVQPGRSKFFKRRFRAAANGNTGVLQNFDAGIKNGTVLSKK